MLADIIPANGYVHGETPTSIDAGIYGFIANIFFYDIDTPLKQFVVSAGNMVRHCRVIHDGAAAIDVAAARFAVGTNSTLATVAVRDIIRTTPTVFVQVGDPVGAGVVQSFTRPGGNLTGFTNYRACRW